MNWDQLPYVSYKEDGTQWFRVWTNQAHFTGGKTISDQQLKTGPDNKFTPEENQDSFYPQTMEPNGCERVDADTFTFTRLVDLPGDASKLQASLGAYSEDSKVNPITSVELRINDQAVTEIHSTPGAPLPSVNSQRTVVDVDATSLVFGENKIEVVVNKKKTKKKLGFCKFDSYGAIAELYGEMLADVSISPPTAIGGSNGESGVAQVSAAVSNAGPTDLIPGRQFEALAVSDDVTVTEFFVSEKEAWACDIQPYSNANGDGFRALCSLPQIAPGASLPFQVTIFVTGNLCPLGSGKKIVFSLRAVGYGETTTTSPNNTRGFSMECAGP